MIARFAASTLLAMAVPASAQDHVGQMMPGMAMPAAKPAPAKRTAPPARRAERPAAKAPARPAVTGSDDHAGHDMQMPDAMPAPPEERAPPAGTALAPGDAPPPAPPADHYADREFPAGAMDAARARMMRENGGQRLHQLLFNLAEAQVRDGRDSYRWDGEGWIGGDIDRAVVRTEGSGSFGGGADAAEVQALYSRAIGPYVDLQAGVRHDIAPTPSRTYATVGIEGLAPYMFDVEAAAFVSTRGELLARFEAWYDQRLTQRLVLQPRVELNLSAQDMPDVAAGAGLVDAELGLRLRYEINRRFAPYLGVSHDARTGRSATYARAAGRRAAATGVVAGMRFWF